MNCTKPNLSGYFSALAIGVILLASTACEEKKSSTATPPPNPYAGYYRVSSATLTSDVTDQTDQEIKNSAFKDLKKGTNVTPLLNTLVYISYRGEDTKQLCVDASGSVDATKAAIWLKEDYKLSFVCRTGTTNESEFSTGSYAVTASNNVPQLSLTLSNKFIPSPRTLQLPISNISFSNNVLSGSLANVPVPYLFAAEPGSSGDLTPVKNFNVEVKFTKIP